MVVACVGVLLAQPVAISAAAESPVVAAYFPSWGVYSGRNYFVTNMAPDRFTHINYAFAKPVYNLASDTAALALGDPRADVEWVYPGDPPPPAPALRGHFNQLIKLKSQYPQVRTLISVGGWTLSDDLSDLAASSNARATFVQSCVQFVTNYHFDGIDLNWEYPVDGGEIGLTHRPEDGTNCFLLVKELRQGLDVQAAFDGRPYLLSIAASADPPSIARRYAMAAMEPYLDWVNLMTYDLAGPWDFQTGHQAPLYGHPLATDSNRCVHQAVEALMAGGIPAAKIVLGLPFYGLGFQGVPTNNFGLFQPHLGPSETGSWKPGTYDFADLKDGTRSNQYIDANGFVRHWDDIAQVPYLYNPTSQVMITYDDAESIGLKVQYAQARHLGGVMFWSVDSDTEAYLLQTVIHQTYHPATMGAAPSRDAPGGFTLQWQGLIRQPYQVQVAGDLNSAPWSPCATLVDTSAVPVTVVTGKGERIVVKDAAAGVATQRFYRLELSL
jgi:chitinase